jgi:hypothetical protein
VSIEVGKFTMTLMDREHEKDSDRRHDDFMNENRMMYG